MMRGLALAFIAVCVIVGARALSGCGGDTNTSPDAGSVALDTLFPKDNDVTGWVEDTDTGKAGVEVYTSVDDINNTCIDGDVVPFQNLGFKALARQNYKYVVGDVGPGYKLDLRLWQMKSTSDASSIYDSIKTSRDPYKVITAKTDAGAWADQTIGEGGRAGNSGNQWLINAHKAAYFIEARITPSDSSDTTGRDQAIAVLKKLVDKL